MLKHIGQKCRFCDPAVRNAVVDLQAQQAAHEGIPSNRPRYGSRKVFFERVWKRLHGGGGQEEEKEDEEKGAELKDIAKKAEYHNLQEEVAAAVAAEAEKISSTDPSMVAATAAAIDDKRKAIEAGVSANEDVRNKKQKTDEEAAVADAENSVEV